MGRFFPHILLQVEDTETLFGDMEGQHEDFLTVLIYLFAMLVMAYVWQDILRLQLGNCSG